MSETEDASQGHRPATELEARMAALEERLDRLERGVSLAGNSTAEKRLEKLENRFENLKNYTTWTPESWWQAEQAWTVLGWIIAVIVAIVLLAR